jgi:hypothetical protein
MRVGILGSGLRGGKLGTLVACAKQRQKFTPEFLRKLHPARDVLRLGAR